MMENLDYFVVDSRTSFKTPFGNGKVLELQARDCWQHRFETGSIETLQPVRRALHSYDHSELQALAK